jgi:hypothetical protein
MLLVDLALLPDMRHRFDLQVASIVICIEILRDSTLTESYIRGNQDGRYLYH